jgi:hypothetical protein
MRLAGELVVPIHVRQSGRGRFEVGGFIQNRHAVPYSGTAVARYL